MKSLREEILENSAIFYATWPKQLETVRTELGGRSDVFEESYLRLTSLQAWRSELLDNVMPQDALAFFMEAQNDAVLSHCLATCGCWRPALKGLRSCLENVMQALYYMDHPVELQQWAVGKHRMQFAELSSYFERHPRMVDAPASLQILPLLSTEFATLSRAVHASSKSFRMTHAAGQVVLFASNEQNLGAWRTRQRLVLTALNLLLIAIFREAMAGTKLLNLKKVISFALPSKCRSAMKAAWSVTIPERP